MASWKAPSSLMPSCRALALRSPRSSSAESNLRPSDAFMASRSSLPAPLLCRTNSKAPTCLAADLTWSEKPFRSLPLLSIRAMRNASSQSITDSLTPTLPLTPKDSERFKRSSKRCLSPAAPRAAAGARRPPPCARGTARAL